MKNTFTYLSRALFAILLLVALPQFASAQSYTISNTTLNGAISATQTTLVLTSASASSGSSFGAPAANQCLMVDAELMLITAMSSTTATVQRSRGGTNTAAPHATLARLWTAPCNAFKTADPPSLSGNQTCSTQPAPWINYKNGNVWWCNTARNDWRGTNFSTFTYNSVPVGQ